ncbi:hypothetical protein T265_08879 [Opisthorchis viverrini]|uniref:Uncharacterized protein n=1 Tax=Opisthorchis viverrini TaxID=6198 RepID=A0A075A703_OPIVI|nr:hypothetical protein T265_08879 [Opisthorchis viverrini]KER23184.1 hypothetical protein T265_08879 [Opisthorchis viverrini]
MSIEFDQLRELLQQQQKQFEEAQLKLIESLTQKLHIQTAAVSTDFKVDPLVFTCIFYFCYLRRVKLEIAAWYLSPSFSRTLGTQNATNANYTTKHKQIKQVYALALISKLNLIVEGVSDENGHIVQKEDTDGLNAHYYSLESGLINRKAIGNGALSHVHIAVANQKLAFRHQESQSHSCF